MPRVDQPETLVNLRKFKHVVERNLPQTSPFYRVIMAEKDELPAESFLSKSEVWLELINISVSSS